MNVTARPTFVHQHTELDCQRAAIATALEIPYELLSGVDDALAAGGALDEGKVGIYDEYAVASPANTRSSDNFVAYDLAASSSISPHALHSARSMRFRHDAIEREDSSGALYGRVRQAYGLHLRLPPSTRNNRPGRLVVKRRRHKTGLASEARRRPFERDADGSAQGALDGDG